VVRIEEVNKALGQLNSLITMQENLNLRLASLTAEKDRFVRELLVRLGAPLDGSINLATGNITIPEHRLATVQPIKKEPESPEEKEDG
jgi:hypothetical protein